MQSRAFRVVSGLIIVLLIAALAGAVGWTVQTQPSTLVLPTPLPTQTPTPTSTPSVAMGAPVAVEPGGFRFVPPAEYALRLLPERAELAADYGPAMAAPRFGLAGGLLATLALTDSAPLAAILAQVVSVAGVDAGVGMSTSILTATLGGESALVVDLVDRAAGQEGRLLVARPADGRYFVLWGLAPAAIWQARGAAELAALAEQVAFFAPTVAVTPAEPTAVATRRPATVTPAPGTQRPPAATPSPVARSTATAIAPVAITSTSAISGASVTTVEADLQPAAPTAVPTTAIRQGTWTTFSDGNVINDLAAISNTLWLATDGGALAWNKGSNNPVKVTTTAGLAANRLTAVANCPLPGFGILFGSDQGLQVIDPRTGRWRTIDSSGGGMRFDDVTAIDCDPARGLLVVGYATHGIDLYDARADTWRHVDRSSGLGANDVQDLALAEDSEAVWVVSGDGITVAAGADSRFYDAGSDPLAGDRIGAVAAGADGVVWLGGEGRLHRVEDGEWRTYSVETVTGDFPAGRIGGIALADGGALWLGADDGEVCRFDVEAARCVDFFGGADGMAEGALTGLVVDRTGQVYYSTAGNGFSTYADGQWRTLATRDEILQGNQVKAVATDEEGNLWAATEQGVQRFTTLTEAGDLFDNANSGIAPLGVRTLHPGVGGGMWVGSMQGASFYDGAEWATFSTADGLAGNTVQAIATDSTGRTWFGTDRGLSVWNGEQFFNIARDRGLPSDDISALAADGDAMWIGTAGGGLYRFEGSQLQLLNQENVGLPSDVITALVRDPEGALWIGTDQGLAHLKEGVFSLAADLGAVEVTSVAVAPGMVWVGTMSDGVWVFDGTTWMQLRSVDGLPSDHVTALLATGATVWIGGQEGGLVRYQP